VQSGNGGFCVITDTARKLTPPAVSSRTIHIKGHKKSESLLRTRARIEGAVVVEGGIDVIEAKPGQHYSLSAEVVISRGVISRSQQKRLMYASHHKVPTWDLILPKASNNFYQNFADIVEAFYPLVSNSSGFILNCFSGLKIGLRRLWNLTDPANFLGLVVFHKNRRAKWVLSNNRAGWLSYSANRALIIAKSARIPMASPPSGRPARLRKL